MQAWLQRRFRLEEHGTTARAELRGGVVTFLTMSYIIFVQPGILSQAGMDFGAVLVATCLASALATLVMALGANYPVALAPCMGENFFFVSVVAGAVTGAAVSWQAALAAVFVSGLLFMALTLFHFREAVLDALPPTLKHAIPVGIGLLVAFLGLMDGGVVVAGAPLRLGDPVAPATLLFFFGLVLTAALLARGVPGALLWGMLVTAATGLATGLVRWQGLVAPPPDLSPVLLRMDLAALWDWAMVPVVVIFLFMVLFDTVGTLVGVGQQAGLVDEEGRLRRAGPALFSDAVGTTAGAALGTSTVSSYIESAAGVAAGARTGLASVVTALCFLAALFFSPLVAMVGGGLEGEGGAVLRPVTGPILVLVGSMMMRGVKRIPWDDPAEAVPALLVILGMPLTLSVADGLALGFLAWPLLQVLRGSPRRVPPLLYILAVLLGMVFVLKGRVAG